MERGFVTSDEGDKRIESTQVLPESWSESDQRGGQKNANGAGEGSCEIDHGDADPIRKLMEITRHHRSLVQARTKITNAINGVERRIAVDRIRNELGEDYSFGGKMPNPNAEDKLKALNSYPEFHECARVLTTAIKEDEKIIANRVKAFGRLNPWIEGTKGLGYKSIGYLLGICGDPYFGVPKKKEEDRRFYEHPRMLVKMLGVAPRDCYYSEEYGKNLVPKHRRSITLYWCLDAVLKHDNKYREVYLNEKRRQVKLNPEFASKTWDEEKATGAKIGADRKARLRAATALIYDLWEEWIGDQVYESDNDTEISDLPEFLE